MTHLNERRLNEILILSTSLLDDRKLVYSGVIDHLTDQVGVNIWAASRRNPGTREMWSGVSAAVSSFPEIVPFREFPYAYLRHVNNAAWLVSRPTAAHAGVERLIKQPNRKPLVRAASALGRGLGRAFLSEALERSVNHLCRRYPRSPEGGKWLESLRPSLVVSTCPVRSAEPAIIAEAQRLRIPTAVVIHSFDNLTTKPRMLYDYDAYLVWSEQMKHELEYLYPRAVEKPIHVVGAPQFDVFRSDRFRVTREGFCGRMGLDPNRPIIVYALGSPRLFPGEWIAPFELAKVLQEARFRQAQLVIRPHPNFNDRKLREYFASCPGVVIQSAREWDRPLEERYHDEEAIVEWTGTFQHADVVVNMSSTATIDAALLDTPVVNIDFDPNPDGVNRELIHEVNHRWEHFKPVAESGAVWLASDHESVADGVCHYLDNPASHREARARIAESVCGFTDGECGRRMAEALLNTLEQTSTSKGPSC